MDADKCVKCGHPEISHEKLPGKAWRGACFHEDDLDCFCGKFKREKIRRY